MRNKIHLFNLYLLDLDYFHQAQVFPSSFVVYFFLFFILFIHYNQLGQYLISEAHDVAVRSCGIQYDESFLKAYTA